MDLSDFDSEFDVGYGLSIEERSALELEMQARKIEENLASIKFWGRITGTTDDYLIVCSLTSVLEVPHKKFYYATTKNLKLQELPTLSEEFQKIASTLSGRFLGNPTKLLGPDAEAEDGEDELDEDGNPKPKRIRFSESHRLAYNIGQIEHECGVVPRGAYTVTPTHHIIPNQLFAGLCATEATQLSQYFHFRQAEHPARRHFLTKVAVAGPGDWMDPLSEDLPKGAWSVRLDAGRAQVTLRTIRWPGYFFWHDVATPRYGGVYFGAGQPNDDLAFMMPPSAVPATRPLGS